MDDFRRYPKSNTRQLISYLEFDANKGENTFLCLDKGIIGILRYLLNTRGSWRSSYYISNEQHGYTTPNDAQWDILEEYIAEANVQMSSCDEIATQLAAINTTLGSMSSSSGGCGCVGSGTDDITEWNDGASQDVPGGEEFPPGFSDRPEYDVYRCKAAYYIVRQYSQTLKNWATLTGVVGALTVATIVGLCLLTVPPIGLTLIISALGLLVATDGALLGQLLAIANAIDSDIDNMTCQLYNTASTGEAVDALRENVRTKIDILGLTPSDTFKTITDNLISNDQMAVLQEKDVTIDGLPSEDCSGCAGLTMGFAFICDTVMGELTSGSFGTPGSHIEIDAVVYPWSCDPGTPLYMVGLWGPGSGTGIFAVLNFECSIGGMEYWGVRGDGSTITFTTAGCPPDGEYKELYMKHAGTDAFFSISFDLD